MNEKTARLLGGHMPTEVGVVYVFAAARGEEFACYGGIPESERAGIREAMRALSLERDAVVVYGAGQGSAERLWECGKPLMGVVVWDEA